MFLKLQIILAVKIKTITQIKLIMFIKIIMKAAILMILKIIFRKNKFKINKIY